MAKQNLKSYLVSHFSQHIISDLDHFLTDCNPNDFGLQYVSMHFSLSDFYTRHFEITDLWADMLADDRIKLYLKTTAALEADVIMYDRLCGEIPLHDELEINLILEYIATPVKEFSDLEIQDVYPEDFEPPLKFPLTSQLVPFFPYNELESIAEQILSVYYPEAMDGSCRVDIQELARRAGLRICWGKFDRDDLHGIIYFKDCKRRCYDSIEALRTLPEPNTTVTNGTALINASLYSSHNHSRAWTAISHEVIHWLLDRKAMYMRMLLYGSKPYLNTNEIGAPDNPSTTKEWMESHADKLAPRLLMPYHPTLAKANEMYAAYLAQNNTDDPVVIIEQIIRNLADFYQVSYEMAKYRMDEIGFSSAKGIMIWLEDHYVPNFKTSTGKFGKYDRYHLSGNQLSDICEKYPNIAEALYKNDLLFVENHLVQNNKMYVIYDELGNLCLTDFARNNIDLCAVCFQMSITLSETTDWPFHHKLYKLQQELHYYYDLSADENLEIQHAPASQLAVSSYDYEQEYMADFPIDNSQAFKYCFNKSTLTEQELADEVGCSRQTISKLMNGSLKAKMELILACAVVMNVPKPAYEELLECFNYHFSGRNPVHNFYRHLIRSYSEAGLFEWNKALFFKGYDPIPDQLAESSEYAIRLKESSPQMVAVAA